MTWEDAPQQPFGKPGGNWGGIRPSYDNPLTWSVPIGRVLGIEVRIHLFFLIFMLVQLGWSLSPDQGHSVSFALGITAMLLGVLFMVVLLHEFGHCLACRAAGGTADEILMWPLGGLAFCAPPHRWKAHFVTVIGGPLVNVAICLILVPVLGVLSGTWWGVALPNPFSLSGLHDQAVSSSLWLTALFLLHWVSLALLLFNLLPMFPLDGGRLIQALLWARIGYVPATRLAVRAGYVGAIILFIFGAVMGLFMLCGVAIFGGIVCYTTNRQLDFTEEFMGDEEMAGFTLADDTPAQRRRAEREAAKIAGAVEAEALRAREVDRILAKIQERGVGSLNWREKRFLRRETRRKRGQQ